MELTVKQAREYARARGRSLSASYLCLALRSGRIRGRSVSLPSGQHCWVIDEAGLATYLAETKPSGLARWNAARMGL